jgi:hypothetical protein
MSNYLKNGILREDEGFDLLVDGTQRTFRGERNNAYAAARELKRTNRNSIVEIRERATGKRQIMFEDGRLG